MIGQYEVKGLGSRRQTCPTALNGFLELIPRAQSDKIIFLSLCYAAFGLKFIWKEFVPYFNHQDYNNACM